MALTFRATAKPMPLAIEPPSPTVPLAEAEVRPSLAPVYYLLVHIGGGVVATAKVRSLDCCQEISQRPCEIARPYTAQNLG
jgi:hypothetical protein